MSNSESFRLSDFTFDLLLQICSYLDAHCLAALCVTCQKLKSAAESPELWCDIAINRWHNLHTSVFPSRKTCFHKSTPTDGIPALSNSDRRSTPYALDNNPSTSGVAWKALVATGNGWDPPRLHHTLLHPKGDYISAFQPLRLPSDSTRGAGVAGGRPVVGDLLLALAGNEQLQVWRTRGSPAPTIGPGQNPNAARGGQSGDSGSDGNRPSGSSQRTGTHNNGVFCAGGKLTGKAAHTSAPAPVLDAVHDLEEGAMLYSLAWLTAAPPGISNSNVGGDGGGGLESSETQHLRTAGGGGQGETDGQGLTGGDTATTPGSWPYPRPYQASTSDSTSTPAAASNTGLGTPNRGSPLLLAAGTSRGVIQWYEYDGGPSRQQVVADAARHLSPPSPRHQTTRRAAALGDLQAPGTTPRLPGQLRLCHSTSCGGPYPVVDLHVLGGAAGSGVGGAAGSGSVLVALQDATFSMVGAGSARNKVHLLDLGTQRHLASVADPFESHEFVCCCPASGSSRASINISGSTSTAAANSDPNVLLLGSVHGSFCRQCFELGLPSLCHHKQHSATAALSTLDVRCPHGGIAQRFGLNHRSLYPRLAAAREYYVFTSHAGTPLEVYDRRSMSAPLFSLPRLPRVHRPHAPGGGGRGGGGGGGTNGTSAPLGYGQGMAEKGGGGEGGGGEGAHGEGMVAAGGNGGGIEGDEGHEDQEEGGGHEDQEEGGGHEDQEEERGHEEGTDSGMRRNDDDMGDEETEQEEWPAAPEDLCEATSAAPAQHQGLWLEACDDVLLGRAENGTVWLWDLSQTLGWPRGPDRSGLWHCMYEHGPLPAADEGFGGQDDEGGAGGWSVAGGSSGSLDPWDGDGSGRRQWRAGRHVASWTGQAVCLGSVACPSSLPIFALAVGNPTALFTLGEGSVGSKYVVQSVVRQWGQELDVGQVGVGFPTG